MGNKRNRTPRNKKPNNWKALKKIRDEKKQKNEFVDVEPSETIEYLDIDGGETTPAVLTDDLTDFDESGDENETITQSTKRRRITNVEGDSDTPPIPVDDNYFACLSEIEDDNEENRVPIDPISIDVNQHEQEENPDDENEDYDQESNEENCGYVSGDNSASDDEEHLEEKITGRRLFQIPDFFQKLKKIGNHSKNCSFNDMILVGEYKKGLNSIFKFQCEKCGTRRKLESCPKKEKSLNCNQEAVLGIKSIGSGFYHLEEFFSNLNVPCMSSTLYDTISKNQQSDWMHLAKELALDALYEEIELAKASGDIDSKGNALIAVIADGGWGKRSYGKKFNSLSGCAVLIGVRTKKVVFFGVRNKYCHTCKIAQSKCTPVNQHECNINYTGPSSGMEADIILEGFKSSEVHGARFHKLIADGDSSTYKILRDHRVYKNPDLVIEKLECINHLCRNYRSKFAFIAKVTKFDSNLRKQIKKCRGNDICKGVKTAAKHWRESNLTLSEKINNLEEDIMNAPLHYFGVHTKCKSYFCSKTTSIGALNNLQLLKDDGLYYEILNLCQVYFAGNAKSLLVNESNNAAEEFNNLVAKYLGGKRINYSLAGSYTARVATAVVQYNTDGHAGSEFRKFKLGEDHESYTKKLEVVRKRKVKYNAAIQNNKPRLRHQTEETASGAYFHGDGFEELDMSPEKFKKCKEIFMEKIENRQKIRHRIEKETRDKKHNSYWHVIRQDLLPSSYFHRIVKSTKLQSLTNILNELLYARSEFGNNAEIKHQRLVQRDGLEVFKELFDGEAVTECGLFIDKNLAFLCSSPLRLYGKRHILSIKCPLKQYNKNFETAMKTIPFFKKKDDHYVINEKSDWYIEIQGDMHITGKNYTYLMIWLGESSYRIIEIAKKVDFFEEVLRPKLTHFYTEIMLKELVDSRVERKMSLRKYDAETKSFI